MGKIDTRLQAALDETGLAWTIERGKRHYKVRLAGRMIGVWPYGAVDKAPRAALNVFAQIRRFAREIKNGSVK